MQQITNSAITSSDYKVNLAFLPTEKTWRSDTQTNNRFIESGEHLVNFLEKTIDQAKEFICFTSFIFQSGKIVDALERATERGVKVFVLTSDLRISQQTIYDDGDEKQAVLGFKNLLNNQLRNKALVRCANNIHAKYLIIDPKSNYSKGYLATCNFTEKATKENPELIAVLNKGETLELFKNFVWHFWEATTDEQTQETEFAKVNKVSRFELPHFESILQTSTAAKQTTIRDNTLKMIQAAKSKIVFSSFGFDASHILGKALLEKCEAGLDVLIFARNRSKPFIGHLDKLAKAGAKIFTHNLLHAKFITVDDEKGAIFTANFEKHGMDQGVEVGLKLNKTDVTALNLIINRWQNSFPYSVKANIHLTSLPNTFSVMKNRGLEIRSITGKTSKSEIIIPQKFNEVINAWSKKDKFDKKNIKKYLFDLTLKLEKKAIHHLTKKELTSNIYWGEYEVEQKKDKQTKKVKKQAIFITDGVDFNNFSAFIQYQHLPIFVLKV